MTIRHLNTLSRGVALRSDVAIVGAGPAGICLAMELADRGVRVTVLEGGRAVADETSQRRYEGELTLSPGLEYPALETWRLRQLGGTSNHWGGWCRRLEANVFEERSWMGAVAWPLTAADLEPHFRRAHELCELGRDEYDADRIQTDLGIRPWTGLADAGLASSVWRYSPPTRFGDRYRARLERDDIDLILDANLVGVEVQSDSVTALSLTAAPGADLRTVQAEVVVIACGGLESVRQLLLLRRNGVVDIDPGGWLGVGFMEHPHGIVATAALDADMADDDSGPLAIFRNRIQDVDGTDVRAGLTVLPEVCAAEELPNMSFTIDPALTSAEALGQIPSGAGVAQMVELTTGSPAAIHRLFVRSEQRFDSESRISLIDDADDLGQQRIRLDWRIAPEDIEAVSRGVRFVARALATLGVALVQSPAEVGELGLLGGGAHHLGGARMHESALGGVVDPDLRVHGVRNLYVCSAATFPTGGYSNPTMTIVALACRLADSLVGAR